MLGSQQQALAATAALEAAKRLGLLARLDNGPVDAAALASDCALGEAGARLLLTALASLGLVESSGDESYRASAPNLVGLAGLLSRWQGLDKALCGKLPATAGDCPAGAEVLYADLAPYLGAVFVPAAELFADRLGGRGWHVLDLGAGAAPWRLALA